MSGEEGESKVSTYETYVSTPSERTVLLVKARGDTWRDKIGLYEPTEPNFWRYVFAEFLYTLLFTMIACGCSLNLGQPRSDLHQAICVGGIVAVLITVSAEKLGYFNPALSFGLLVAGEIKFVRFFVYAAVQVAGSKYCSILLEFHFYLIKKSSANKINRWNRFFSQSSNIDGNVDNNRRSQLHF